MPTMNNAINNKKKWTDEEDCLLIKLCKEKDANIKKIAIKMGRTYSSIAGRIYFIRKKNDENTFLMQRKVKASNEELCLLYEDLKSVWKVAGKCGMCGQSVHERLSKIGVIKTKFWTQEEENLLKKLYSKHNGEMDNIKIFFKGRTRASIACKANELSITDTSRKILNKKTLKKMSEISRNRIIKNGHPRGMKGKNHSEETKKIMSEKHKKLPPMSEETKQKISDTHKKNFLENNFNKKQNNYSRSKMGYYDIDGEIMFFRSSWEPVYAKFLNILIKTKVVDCWEHESETFWFNEIKRGVRSYTPDFKVFFKNGEIEYHEVKGWMDDRSKTKISRMKKYHPEVKLVLIDQKIFNQLKKQFNFKLLNPICKNKKELNKLIDLK